MGEQTGFSPLLAGELGLEGSSRVRAGVWWESGHLGPLSFLRGPPVAGRLGSLLLSAIELTTLSPLGESRHASKTRGGCGLGRGVGLVALWGSIPHEWRQGEAKAEAQGLIAAFPLAGVHLSVVFAN